MKKVMVFGAFDGIHYGHLWFFSQAKKFGDFLIVSVGCDSVVKKIKGRKPLFNQKERLELVKNLRIVNQAVLGDEKDFFVHIKKLAPDIICLGYDQWATEKYVEGKLAKVGLVKTRVVRLGSYKPSIAKSTILKRGILNNK